MRKIILIGICISLLLISGCSWIREDGYYAPKCLSCGCEEGYICVERGYIGTYCIKYSFDDWYRNATEEEIEDWKEQMEKIDDYCGR